MGMSTTNSLGGQLRASLGVSSRHRQDGRVTVEQSEKSEETPIRLRAASSACDSTITLTGISRVHPNNLVAKWLAPSSRISRFSLIRDKSET